MRIIRAILFGLVGVVIGLGTYDIVLTLTGYEYGLVVSLIGMLTAAHVVLAYLGKNDRGDKADRQTLFWLVIFFATLGAVAPYFVLTSFGDAGELIFVAIGIYGGYEFMQYYWGQYEENNSHEVEEPPTTKQLASSTRLRIYARKMWSVLRGYLLTIIIIVLLGNLFFPGLGVSWILVIILAAYEFWKKRVFVITDDDL